ncbi:MAG: hypothetical protein QOJ71_2234 [Actinomycetota bacterium]|nr:hypothetical protein [Actinomycetota bacterium]
MGMRFFSRGVIGGVVFIALAGCTGHSTHRASVPPTPPTPTTTTAQPATRPTSVTMQRFSDRTAFGLTFEHPRAWIEFRYRRSSSFSDLITYASNTRLHDPCTTTRSPNVETTTCGDPVTRLGPGGVLVSWSNIGFPHTGPEIPHPNMTIDGQPTRFVVTKPGGCARLGAEETVTVDIARPIGNHFEMVACLRDPDLAGNEALVRQMLASVRISG